MELHGCIFMPLKVNRKLVSIDLPSRVSEFIASNQQKLPGNMLPHSNMATSLACPRLPEHRAINTQFIPSLTYWVMFYTPLQQAKKSLYL